MPASTVTSVLDFNIFAIIINQTKSTIDQIWEVLKKEFDQKKIQSNVRKLQKNGLVKISKKGECQLTQAGKKEFKSIDKRFIMISSLDKEAQAA